MIDLRIKELTQEYIIATIGNTTDSSPFLPAYFLLVNKSAHIPLLEILLYLLQLGWGNAHHTSDTPMAVLRATVRSRRLETISSISIRNVHDLRFICQLLCASVSPIYKMEIINMVYLHHPDCQLQPILKLWPSIIPGHCFCTHSP